MNFLKELVALDVREARRGLSLEVERGLCFTASTRIAWAWLRGFSRPIKSRRILISWAGIRPRGQGPLLLIWKEEVLDFRSGSGDILWRRLSWIRIPPAPSALYFDVSFVCPIVSRLSGNRKQDSSG